MQRHAARFRGKRVFEIGTGSGMISLFAAKLGAEAVIASDIDPRALESAAENARRLGFSHVIGFRLVTPDDLTAYSVLDPDERFDIIISNPPYALDLDAGVNNPVTESGDLGFSIVRGLEQRVRPAGFAMLYYGTFFYHQVMVKFARHSGLDVRNHAPRVLAPWETETLFNSYLARLLEYQGLDRGAFAFSRQDVTGIRVKSKYGPLFGDRTSKPAPGWMIIRPPARTSPDTPARAPSDPTRGR
jgi:SAM-dependent methyltransferase